MSFLTLKMVSNVSTTASREEEFDCNQRDDLMALFQVLEQRCNTNGYT